MFRGRSEHALTNTNTTSVHHLLNAQHTTRSSHNKSHAPRTVLHRVLLEVLPEGMQDLVGEPGADLAHGLILLSIGLVARQQVRAVLAYRTTSKESDKRQKNNKHTTTKTSATTSESASPILRAMAV